MLFIFWGFKFVLFVDIILKFLLIGEGLLGLFFWFFKFFILLLEDDNEVGVVLGRDGGVLFGGGGVVRLGIGDCFLFVEVLVDELLFESSVSNIFGLLGMGGFIFGICLEGEVRSGILFFKFKDLFRVIGFVDFELWFFLSRSVWLRVYWFCCLDS